MNGGIVATVTEWVCAPSELIECWWSLTAVEVVEWECDPSDVTEWVWPLPDPTELVFAWPPPEAVLKGNDPPLVAASPVWVVWECAGI